MLIIHFVGLAMGVGAGLASLFLSIVNSRLPKEEAIAITKKNLSLIYLAKTGLILLIVSGFSLMSDYWKSMRELPWLHVKFTLVFLLLVNLIIMAIFSKKAKKEGGEAYLPKIKFLGRISVVFGLGIIICAVKTFH